jgi:hypothetical protein
MGQVCHFIWLDAIPGRLGWPLAKWLYQGPAVAHIIPFLVYLGKGEADGQCTCKSPLRNLPS